MEAAKEPAAGPADDGSIRDRAAQLSPSLDNSGAPPGIVAELTTGTVSISDNLHSRPPSTTDAAVEIPPADELPTCRRLCSIQHGRLP